jgi:hypothetical protein
VAHMAEAELLSCAVAGRFTACAVRMAAPSLWEPAITEVSGMVPAADIGAGGGGPTAWAHAGGGPTSVTSGFAIRSSHGRSSKDVR